MTVTGRIHSFQSMGAVDGPGLRYVVFMQGCPSRCAYCHNPDTWDFLGGTEYSPKAVADMISRYKPYLKNGGVTVSGGEPLMQPDFLCELFRLLKNQGLHTALDTSGIGNLKKAEQVLEYTDLVLMDVKFLNQEDYNSYCRMDFSSVLDFLHLVREKDISMWIRRVVVPGINDSEQDIRKLVSFLKDYPNTEKIELLPFRKLCLEKYCSLGVPFPLADTPEMGEPEIEKLKKFIPKKFI